MDVAQFNTLYAAVADESPTGLWAGAPALAASTVAMTNTSGHDIDVNITGGTVTAVKKNGVTLASATGVTIRVRPGHTWSVTYSVAPTQQVSYA
jgi:hypothetical protein